MTALRVSACAAVLGAVALIFLFPHYDPAASVHVTFDRTQAIAMARRQALAFGLETTGWSAAVFNEAVPRARDYAAEYPQDDTAKLFSPLKTTVVLNAPGAKRKIEAAFFADGGPAVWLLSDSTAPGAATPSAVGLEDIAKQFLGARRAAFGQPDIKERDGATHARFERPSSGALPLAAVFEVTQRSGALVSARLVARYTDPFESRFKANDKSRPIQEIALWFRFLWLVPALVICVRFAARRRFTYRIPLVLMLVQLAWAGVSFWGSTYQQIFAQFQRTGNDINISPGIENHGWSAWAGIAFISFFLFAGAGYPLRAAGNREKWFTLGLVTEGNILNRTVGQSLAVGLLSGVALAAVPYVVAAVSRTAMQFHSVDALVAQFPPAVAIRLSAAVLAVQLFGFVYPVTGYLRKPWLRWGAFVAAGVLVTLLLMPFQPLRAAIPACLLVFWISAAIYFGADLLAVMAALIAARAIIVPALLLCQPVGSLRVSGFMMLGVGLALLATVLHFAVRGRNQDTSGVPYTAAAREMEDLDAPSDRERLQAEFDVARKAQRDALPSTAPELAGYSLAGSCQPALQVGGDLYDYFELPDGRLGITVADVSGKGVPAALYMMVTKGLLLAVSRDTSNLADILRQANLHLYRACRRKVFVTMAVLVLDPSGNRVQYGRAGHNPLVWRRTRRGETLMLKPQGLGLGMCPNEAFHRNLEVQEFEVEPDDVLVLYSDGITEAVNHSMEQYGETRLMDVLRGAPGNTAMELRDALLRDLEDFMGTTPARDDITLVVLKAGAERRAAGAA